MWSLKVGRGWHTAAKAPGGHDGAEPTPHYTLQKRQRPNKRNETSGFFELQPAILL
jgi:hypothetical protein